MSTGINPFEALFGEKLSWKNAMHEKKFINISAACKQTLNLIAMQKLLKKCLTKAVILQAKHYNSKYQPCKSNIKDFLYFNSQNIELICLFKKLDWKFDRLYKVIELVDKQAYKLKLFQWWGYIIFFLYHFWNHMTRHIKAMYYFHCLSM